MFLLNFFFIIAAVLLYNGAVDARSWCPPKSFLHNVNRTIVGFRTAIITEVHSLIYTHNLSARPFLLHFTDGNSMARYIYHHVGVLGIDKVHIAAFYNSSMYPVKPTIEDIYPSSQYCVSDWYKLGAVDWRPAPYEGHQLQDKLYKPGKPTIDMDYYKTIRGYNTIYAEIKDFTDWIFVLDSDEYLLPVNFKCNEVPLDWCGKQRPSLVSQILNDMLLTSTRAKLDEYERMVSNETLDVSSACIYGYSYKKFMNCVPIQAFTLPVYTWLQPTSHNASVPFVQSRFPSAYSFKFTTEYLNGQHQSWKSVYQTKYNPPLQGRSLHWNHARHSTSHMAPRSNHGLDRLSLEIAHVRGFMAGRNLTFDAPVLMQSEKWRDLHKVYKRCQH